LPLGFGEWFYAGLYRNLFFSRGNVCKPFIPHTNHGKWHVLKH